RELAGSDWDSAWWRWLLSPSRAPGKSAGANGQKLACRGELSELYAFPVLDHVGKKINSDYELLLYPRRYDDPSVAEHRRPRRAGHRAGARQDRSSDHLPRQPQQLRSHATRWHSDLRVHGGPDACQNHGDRRRLGN